MCPQRCGQKIQKYGTTDTGKQRWRCVACGGSFTRTRPDQRQRRQSVWFSRWIAGETIQQLTRASSMSKATLHRLLLGQLARPVPPSPVLAQATHILFDAKFLFGRKYCLLVILDAITHRPIAGTIVAGETRACILPWLYELRGAGLQPVAVTTDGRRAGIYAFWEVWPEMVVQRCLFHIRLQVESWTRQRPRYDSAKALKQLVSTICTIDTPEQAARFRAAYVELRRYYGYELATLDKTHPVQGDLLKAYQLVHFALPHCFYYLGDPRIAKTTSPLEGYFKQVQRIRGFQHCGLTEEHLFQFLAWRMYFDGSKTNMG